MTVKTSKIFTKADCLPKLYCLELQSRKTIMHHTDEEGHGAVEKKDLYLPFAASYLFKYNIETLNLKGCKPIAVDPMMKIYKLDANNGSVPLHTDTDYVNDVGLEAKYSILVYLNEDYTGGETLFESVEKHPHPATGDCLVFKHDIPHEGLPVISGTKYVLKTDLFVK